MTDEEEDERSVSCVDIRRQAGDHLPGGAHVPGHQRHLGRERSFSDQLEMVMSANWQSDTLMRKLREL